MRMGRCLARMETRSGVLDKAACNAEAAIGLNPQRCETSASVIRNQYILTGRVDDQVAGGSSTGEFLIEHRQAAACTINCECRHASARLALEGGGFVNCIEVFVIRVHGQERGVVCASYLAVRDQFTGAEVQNEGVDTFTLTRRVGANVDEQVRCSLSI